MQKLLKKYFGYDEFRAGQREIIEETIKGRDCLVLMPTGGGKSLCFQLPALMLSGLTVVISPLISLMKDQVDQLQANGIAAGLINSTMAPAEISATIQQAEKGILKILYLAPERLALSGFLDFLKRLKVSLIAIDEAHCISEWGHDFRPDYRNLKNFRKIFPQTPLIALTATATEKVKNDIVAQLTLHNPKIFISSFDRPNLSYRVLPKKNSSEQLSALLKKYQNESVIIYCFSRKDTDELTGKLKAAGFKAAAYHAGLSAEARTKAQDLFIKDKINIIAATIAFGMGINKPDVRLVIHMDLPKSIENYYQETGRAGRDGLSAECVLFFSPADRRKQAFFIQAISDEAEQNRAWEKLETVLSYGSLNQCRHRFLLNYFGEEYEKENCQACDICLEPAEKFNGTEIAQKIISAVIRTNQQFGGAYIARILLGQNDKRIRQFGHDQLSVYGIVDNFSREQLSQIIDQLITNGLLQKTPGQYPLLRLTAFGQNFLNQRLTIDLHQPKAANRTVEKKINSSLIFKEPPSFSRRGLGVVLGGGFDQELFDKLRTLRTDFATRLNMPPYIIFSDKSLQEMAAYFPQSPESFKKIFGVGEQKLEKFGTEFLAVIINYAKIKNLPEKIIADNFQAPAIKINLQNATYDQTKELLLKKIPLEEIAKRRGLKLGTIITHLEKLSAEDENIPIEHLKPETKRLEKIKAAFEKSGSFALTRAKEILGDDYSYDELHLARIFLKILEASLES
jgi:ATP-dependent DNA helicase RecQ